MKKAVYIFLFLIAITSCSQPDKPKPEVKPQEVKSDTLITSYTIEFGFLNREIDLPNFQHNNFSDTMRLGKITNENLTKLEKENWSSKLGAIAYIKSDGKNRAKTFTHGNFEGEEFYLVSQHESGDFVWNIVGGFCENNACSYHLLIQNKSTNNAVLFIGLGYVGFNSNPLTVDEFANDRLIYTKEDCYIEDSSEAKAESLQIKIQLDLENEMVLINREKSVWNKKDCD